MATERPRRERSFAWCDRRAPDTLVSGGTGFIGRWLLVELVTPPCDRHLAHCHLEHAQRGSAWG
jgi:hypothetical protein